MLLLFHPKEMKPRPDLLTFQGKKLDWKGARIFTRVPSQGIPQILASEATGNHPPKWGEGVEVKEAAADPKDLSMLLEGLSLSPSLSFRWNLSQPALPRAFSGGG